MLSEERSNLHFLLFVGSFGKTKQNQKTNKEKYKWLHYQAWTFFFVNQLLEVQQSPYIPLFP